MTSDVLLTTLAHVWKVMERAKIDAALIDGMAVTAWGYFRATRDVDLLIAVDLADWPDTELRLGRAGIELVRVQAPRQLGQLHVVQTECRVPDVAWELEVDFLLAQSEYHRAAIQRSVPFVFSNMSVAIRVLKCEDVILLKLLAGRLLDVDDARRLLIINGATLDNAYLDEAARQLAVGAALQQVREAAASE